MKQILMACLFLCLFGFTRAQENLFSLSGGYSFANIEDAETNSTGWRINGLYEFNPSAGSFSHGVSIGYIRTNGESDALVQTTYYKLNSIPVYYAPKYMFGSESFKGFVKGALGMHYSFMTRTGGLGELSTHDWGFYGGASAGIMYFFNEKLFLNLEYEWAYLSNTYYRDGFMNSAMGGIGIRF